MLGFARGSRVVRRPAVGFRLYGVTNRSLLGEGKLDKHLAGLCRHGLRGVQIREKGLDDGELADLAERCRAVFDRYQVQWFVNASVESARASGSTGIQLTARQDVALARADLGEHVLIGKSVHAPQEAAAAGRAGADFVVFGPVFPTESKAGIVPPQGLARLKEACESAGCPVFAIGGVTPERARECLSAGAHGVAAMSALMRCASPEELLGLYEYYLDSL